MKKLSITGVRAPRGGTVRARTADARRGDLRAAFLACSAQQALPPSSHGVPTPLATDGAQRATAPATQGAAAGPLRLEEFTPLLALPALQRAAQALEAGDAARAGREVEQVMTKTPPAAADVGRWQLLLARLREQAGDLRGAAASYDLAASASWPLNGYALLGAGRVPCARDARRKLSIGCGVRLRISRSSPKFGS